MKPFTKVTSVAAVFDEDDIDTDIIFPARFLLLLDKAGLAKHAFHERRHKPGGAPSDFVLDTPPFDKAQILVAGRNFGSGSSREQAVWCLADFGIRCIIAPSFGEIFYANCFKNGVLPIIRSEEEIEAIRAAGRSGEALTVDLEGCTVAGPGFEQGFEIDPYRRDALLAGLDEIGSILAADEEAIARFEQNQRGKRPWLHLDRSKLSHFDDLAKEDALG